MAKTVYDLLRALVNGSSWHTEAEKVEYLDAVNSAERIGVFGNAAENLDGYYEGTATL